MRSYPGRGVGRDGSEAARGRLPIVLLDLAIGGLTGAGYGEKIPERLAQALKSSDLFSPLLGKWTYPVP